MSYRMLESPDGSIYSKMKQYGNNIIPIGCHYNPADRIESLRKRLSDSIFKSLFESEKALQKYFKISLQDISYEACVGSNWAKNVSLAKSLELSLDCIGRLGDDDFTLQLVVNIKRQVAKEDVQVWGTVIDIRYWKEEWYEKSEDENFSVWLYSVAGTWRTIDQTVGNVETQAIVTAILNHTKQDYNKYYPQVI